MEENEWPIESVVYKEADGKPLKLLVCRPEGWSEGDGRSAVVWIHGGGWSSGDPERFERHCRIMAGRGAVSFSVQYRLLPQQNASADRGSAASIEDCIADCRSAVRYIRTHAWRFGIRPDRIAVAGDSAGGHLAACLATLAGPDEPGEETSVSAAANLAVNCNGIVDFTGKWKTMVPELQAPAGDEAAAVQAWMERHERAKSLSPLYKVAAGQPPMLILHGLADGVVVPEDAVRFHEAYREAGNESRLVLYPGWKHAFILFDYTAAERDVLRAIEEIGRFLDKHGYFAP